MAALSQAKGANLSETMRSRVATVRMGVTGTCGELVQGALDGLPCLMSCPIDRYSVVDLTLWSESGWVFPPDARKTAASIGLALTQWEQEKLGGRLQLTSPLPRGRGYGSSTADIGAALYALSQAVGKAVSAIEVAKLASRVEPTDSSVFPGLTLFDHVGGTFHSAPYPPPRMHVVVLDPGVAVDTVGFNRSNHREALRRLATEHRVAFDLLVDGLRSNDLQTVGEAASLSAKLHQEILENALLDIALDLAREVKALGVCRAHSGTLLGLLLDSAVADAEEVIRFVTQRIDNRATVALHRLVGGGARQFNLEEKPNVTDSAKHYSEYSAAG